MRSAFWYSVEDDSDRFSASSQFTESEVRAEVAADDFWSQHDGWEASWPLTFSIYETEDGPCVARVLVEMEHVPVFYGREVEKADADAALAGPARTETR